MTNTDTLKGYQRKYLRGLAHALKPVVWVGQKGANHAVAKALDEALTKHELVKVKFIEDKEKEKKQHAAEALGNATGSHLVGHIGHTAIFFRPHPDSEKRHIILPQAKTSES